MFGAIVRRVGRHGKMKSLMQYPGEPTVAKDGLIYFENWEIDKIGVLVFKYKIYVLLLIL